MDKNFNSDNHDSAQPEAGKNSIPVHELKTEIVRKAIHLLIALSPLMASINRLFTLIFLAAGTLVFTFFEILRLKGINIPLVSYLTRMAKRPKDKDRFVTGPITLGLGAFLSILLFSLPAASVAIYALAFGDGLAGLFGRLFGRLRPRFLFGKSIEGSLICFIVVFLVSYLVLRDLQLALYSALAAMLVESFPLGDYDNIIMPLAVGTVVQFIPKIL